MTAASGIQCESWLCPNNGTLMKCVLTETVLDLTGRKNENGEIESAATHFERTARRPYTSKLKNATSNSCELTSSA